jgi:hypothetical protein
MGAKMKLGRFLQAGIVFAALAPAIASASPFTHVSSVGGAPTGVTKENFDNLILGTLSPQVTGTGISVQIQPDAAVVLGSVSGVYAAPNLSGGNGLGFGPGGTDQADGANATPYLTSGSTGSLANAAISLTLPFDAKYIGLLWGSVDGYNTLSFYDSTDTLIGQITGADVAALPNGDQGPQGTRYVNINSNVEFRKVVATSTQFAFEFDNVAFNDRPIIIETPEPGTLAILGTALLGLGAIRRRRATA